MPVTGHIRAPLDKTPILKMCGQMMASHIPDCDYTIKELAERMLVLADGEKAIFIRAACRRIRPGADNEPEIKPFSAGMDDLHANGRPGSPHSTPSPPPAPPPSPDSPPAAAASQLHLSL